MFKYRVKIVTHNNGKQKFYPQYKYCFFWFCYVDGYKMKIVKDSIESAELYIREKKNGKIISVEYKEVN